MVLEYLLIFKNEWFSKTVSDSAPEGQQSLARILRPLN